MEKTSETRTSRPESIPLYGIGEVEGRMVRVMPYYGHTCRECCFFRQQQEEHWCPIRFCQPHRRADGNGVYFQEVER